MSTPIMRAKMKVISVLATEYGEDLKLSAVCKHGNYPESGVDEDNSFAKFTPSAERSSTASRGVSLFRSVNPSASAYAPYMFAIRLALLVAILTTAGCAWGKRSSGRIVEGDSSTIKYTNREEAGGPIGGR